MEIPFERSVPIAGIIVVFWFYWLYRYWLYLSAIGKKTEYRGELDGTTKHYLLRYLDRAFLRAPEVQEVLKATPGRLFRYRFAPPTISGLRGQYNFVNVTDKDAPENPTPEQILWSALSTPVLLRELLIARVRGFITWIVEIRSFSEYYFPLILAVIPAYIFVMRRIFFS